MSFQTPLTICQIITDIHAKKYLLPSIQREFVWSQEQIITLFDSLMRDYPINAFLFWKVPKEKSSEFMFYEFLRDYHQKENRHNPKANISGSDDVMAVLDGQQRLTSLYLALKGTYASKLSYKHWSNALAYPKKKFYLNLLSKPDDQSLEYEFDFLSDEDAKESDDCHFWFPVGKILDMREQDEVNDYLVNSGLLSFSDKEKSRFANKALFKLHKVIHITPTISYYLEQSTELDKVLNIFIRVNRGGTPLSYPDLLLSFATSQWKKRDAREEINAFVDEVNMIGHGFSVTKDAVLKACLVLCDIEDISFKVDNFNRTNMLRIESEWDNITKAIRDAVTLVSSFGFSRENVTSNNLIIPIAYYLKTIGLPNNFEVSSSRVEDRKNIKKWFISSLLKRVFSFSPDGILKPVREMIKESGINGFPTAKIIEYFKGTNRTLLFSEDDMVSLLESKHGQGDTLVVLSILYPWTDLRHNFHLDHMFPKSTFTPKRLETKGVPTHRINDFISKCNYIGNLQIIESIPNIEKQAMDFDIWLTDKIPEDEIADYKRKHYVPNTDISFSNFDVFFEKRNELLLHELKAVLQ